MDCLSIPMSPQERFFFMRGDFIPSLSLPLPTRRPIPFDHRPVERAGLQDQKIDEIKGPRTTIGGSACLTALDTCPPWAPTL